GGLLHPAKTTQHPGLRAAQSREARSQYNAFPLCLTALNKSHCARLQQVVDFPKPMGSVFRQYFFCLLAAVLGLPLGQAATVTFEVDVRPILKAHCFHCHGEDGTAKGGLDVRLRKLLLKGGKHGPAIAPGQAEKSLLFQKVRDGEMPKEQAKLPAGKIETLRRWIEQGAETARPEPDTPDDWITEEEHRYWAFQPIRNPAVPVGAKNPVDAFLLRRLKAKRLGFSPEAGKRTLIRRATFDLTGLPPTPAEIGAFL
ncbi:uncharacterized protein METZ01_LOCUS452759, partial [marine metagenome]